ncbi:MAG: hypothetical protein AAGH79_17490, partial [Bacteroidota bacterium]
MHSTTPYTRILWIGLFLLGSLPLFAQPSDLPWEPDSICGGVLTQGIAIATCGLFDDVPVPEQWSLGLINVNEAVPDFARIDVTNVTDMYHHPSWLVNSIGNVFGITIDHCANFYVSASSNYAPEFLGQTAMLQYGNLGGGPNDLEAAGTIYKIDAITAEAAPWAVLPQQAYSFLHYECFGGGGSMSRTTGPGLGNVTFSFETFNFYATNFEDGRIYRLDTLGTILESFDPFFLDDGFPGPPDNLNEVPYGVAVSPDNTELFFGNCYNKNASNEDIAGVFSIPLNPDGSFIGTVDNSNNPANATWDNLVGVETFHAFLSEIGGFNTVSFISDLEFTPAGKLLCGSRSGCSASLHSNYDEYGRTEVLSLGGGGLYDNNEGIIYLGNAGFYTSTYGGVASYVTTEGATEYISSCADMETTVGPHGIIVTEEDIYGFLGDPVSPAAIISYNDNTNSLFVKGNGGDVQVFQECACEAICPLAIATEPLSICSEEIFSLTVSEIGGNAPIITTWTDENNIIVSDPSNVSITHTDCAPGTYLFFVTAECEADQSITFTDTLEVTVTTNDIQPFITFIEQDCFIGVEIAVGCEDYISLTTPLPNINIGDSGSITAIVEQSTDPVCTQVSQSLNYNCQCIIDDFQIEPQECELGEYFITLNFAGDGIQQSFTLVDQNDVDYGTFNYTDLPIELGPFTGDNVSTYTLFIEDASQVECSSSVEFGPFYCPPALATWEVTDPTCLEDFGTLEALNVTGGEAPYTYSVDGGISFSADPFFSPLDAGTYQVLVRDAQGNVIQD